MRTISAKKLAQLLNMEEPIALIDVRTPAEFQEIHVDGARLVPLDSFVPNTVVRSLDRHGLHEIYLICRSGARVTKAAELLEAAGYGERAVVVEGGTLACEAVGLSVTRGKKTISLERQVRIAAGSLVLIGIILGLFVHSWLFGLAGFVGAGLVFAGLTDSCGMAMILAKMPWNHVGDGVVHPSQAADNSRAA